ncbi:bifunctional glycosyltransferase/CDP-glycerol:glycerophosphate glycerophosphotransferase [Wenjunlia tyrosinilytica]|uniref:Transferase n=1 Tax=Wenjunlia tyrosinilytica TaxID=1544741 RepID=A0A918DYA9_9ACTN|nr:CDP-glycerol:glycerophosphate glycerophosphotransferase [Wenjunlia tyrosinilytica]GGO90174.1 transferase [Wenjunlia tyrosinilytica]
MITVSVVVTARNAQAHLRECLDSALGLPAGDGPALEILGIDNASTDGTGAILDEYADRCPIKVLHLPRRLPTGAARDAGAALAHGSYLLFLSGQDALVPGALRSLTDRLEEAAEPDVLVFDHVVPRWWNPAIPSRDTGLLGSPSPVAFSLADRPRLLRTTATLSNRLLRTAFYLEHRDLFTQDALEEILPALGSLLAADRLAVLDSVCVRRRAGTRPAPEALAEYPNLFTQYDALMDLLDSRPDADQFRPAVFSHMVNRYLRALASSEMPERARADFFHRASERFTRFLPSTYRRPAGLSGIRHSLLEHDRYTGYRALRTANRRRRAVRDLVTGARHLTGEMAREGYYREQLLFPLADDLAVFSAYWDRAVTCNPAAISAKLTELAPHIRQVWVLRRTDAALVPTGADHVVPGTRRYFQVLARAKYLVSNVNFPDFVVKRPGQVHVMTHHGTPLKRMGTDQLAFPAISGGEDYDALLERCGRWDFSVSANGHSTETWEHAYPVPVPFTSLDYGYPRNDVYCTATAEDVRRIRERLGIRPGRTALLYAPTHRDYEAGWTPRLDFERLAGRLGDDFVLLVRGHYYYSGGPSQLERLHRRGVVVDVSGYASVEELALASDALITDYSSLMFDYANLDRPLVVYADDWETYAVTRGVYFDLMEHPPGPVARTEDDVAEVFVSGRWRGPESNERRAAFRRRFCQFDDGHAAERVVRHVFLGIPGTPPVVPIEHRTPAPAPAADRTPPDQTPPAVPLASLG